MSERPADAGERARSQLRHALATPLNQIIGYSEMLQEDAAELCRDGMVADLKKIEQAGRNLLALIDEHLRGGVRPRCTGVHALADDSAPTDAAAIAVAQPESGSASLLVVDDNEHNRDMLSRRLVQRGYRVRCAAGGREALALLAVEAFDLVLLDVMMPDLSGLEVLDEVRRQRTLADLPIVMATAQDASEDIVEALRRGANDYVTKPLDLPVVLARVESQLALKRARDEVAQLNRELDEAHARIATLSASTPAALDDVPAWSASVAAELRRALGVPAVDLWLFDDGAVSDAATGVAAADVLAAAAASRPLARRDAAFFPIAGISGEVLGSVVVRVEGGQLREASQRLVAAFARQLGGALELRRLRADLARATERQRVTCQSMLDRGIDLLRVCPSCWRCYDQRAEKCEADGASLQPLEALPFRIAGRYRMVRFVGEGGMGTVYRAHDERLAREVAVKVLRGEHFNNPTLRARFEHEARAVARIDHPGVIAVYDSGENEDGSLYIVMEWLSGVDLGQLLASCGPGTPREVAELLRQGAAALGAAHRAAIVHRDIKPENIFLSPAPGGGLRVKLLDFGVAKELAGESASLTQTGIVIGTPLYMAPEQVRGDPVGPRCDLYSFAAVAYEALCGRRVTAASDYVRILMAVVDEQPPPSISSALPDAPAEVDHAFARALAKRPDARPGDVEEWVGSFVDALERMPARAAGWGPALRELLHGEPTAEMTVARARHEAATAQALEERTRCERAPRRGGQ